MPGGLTGLEGGVHTFAALDRRLLRDDAAPIAVALSGGGDSLALLRLAQHWARQAGRSLLALTVDHRLNPDSRTWTRFAAARAAESGARFRALSWDGDKPAAGLPAAARAARHALLATAAREAGAAVILLGHTADDVAETDLMRGGDAPGIGRLREWSPSPAWPQGRGVMLLRPMLAMRRADLRRWLADRGETWLDDPANEDLRFARVRARDALAAPFALQGGRVGDGGASRSSMAGGEGGAAPASAFTLSPRSPTPGPSLLEGEGSAVAATAVARGETLSLPAAVLRQADAGAAAHVLSVATLCAGGGVAPPRRRETERLVEHVLSADPRAATLRGARIEVRGGDILFSREAGDRRRNPRPEIDGVVDGRFIPSPHGADWLVLDRFRAACFLIRSEGDLRADQNQRLALNQISGPRVLSTISPSAQA